MTPEQIASVTQDRFGRWSQNLRNAHATPILVLGIDTSSGQAVVCTCEGFDDDTVIKILESARAMIRNNRHVKRPRG